MGINYSHAIPGTSPGEFLASREQIATWIDLIGELGVNSVRVYTVQSPIFYEALRHYNLEHANRPIFLLQGAWLKEPEEDHSLPPDTDYLSPSIMSWFRDELEKVVDVVHGNRVIEPGSPEKPTNYGRAYGTFTADVSPWLMGWLIGREVEPLTIMKTHNRYCGTSGPGQACPVDYHGEYFSIEDGTPMEAFITEHLDYITKYEADNYRELHTIGFSNWPTLDPLYHPIEPRYNASVDDMEQLDLLKVKIDARFDRGMFFSYHAYPYYPEFILYQPEYQVSDEIGPNSYLGYLQDLRRYYEGRTLLIAEIGHPSSQGSAHLAKSGLSHGNLNDVEQGEALTRSLRTITRARLDGAFMFELIDEWFKRAWVVDRVDFPAEQRRLWYNAMSPEQNFGLIAMRPGERDNHHVIDGKGDDFPMPPQASKTDPVLAPMDAIYDPMRNIRALTVDHDEGFLHLCLRVDDLDPDGDGKVNWERVDYLFAIDTVQDPKGKSEDRGDKCIDPGPSCDIRLERGAEFLLRINSDDDVRLLVDKPYDLYGLWHRDRKAWQKYRSTDNADGEYHLVRTYTNWQAEHEDKLLTHRITQYTGLFRTGLEAEESNSNFWYSIDEGTLEVRIPLNLLNFTDPSQKQVVDDYLPGAKSKDNELQTSKTPAVAVMAVALGGSDEKEETLVDTLPRAKKQGMHWLIPAQGAARHTWDDWDESVLHPPFAPSYHSYKKRSFTILQENLPEIAPPSAGLDR